MRPAPGPITPRQARRCTDPREPTNPVRFRMGQHRYSSLISQSPELSVSGAFHDLIPMDCSDICYTKSWAGTNYNGRRRPLLPPRSKSREPPAVHRQIGRMGFHRRRTSELRLTSKPGTLSTRLAGAVGPKPRAARATCDGADRARPAKLGGAPIPEIRLIL